MALTYVKARARIGLVVGDGPSDPDEDPDTIWCDAGTITLVPLIGGPVKVADGDPVPYTLAIAPIACGVDTSGHLTYGGERWVSVVDLTDAAALNPAMGAGSATYRVDYKGVTAGGTAVSLPSQQVRIAADMMDEDGWCDLTLLSPVTVVNGVPQVVGPRGPIGPRGLLIGDWAPGSYEAGAIVSHDGYVVTAAVDTSQEPAFLDDSPTGAVDDAGSWSYSSHAMPGSGVVEFTDSGSMLSTQTFTGISGRKITVAAQRNGSYSIFVGICNASVAAPLTPGNTFSALGAYGVAIGASGPSGWGLSVATGGATGSGVQVGTVDTAYHNWSVEFVDEGATLGINAYHDGALYGSWTGLAKPSFSDFRIVLGNYAVSHSKFQGVVTSDGISSTDWAIVSQRGPQGAPGIQGTPGADGTDGDDGAPGPGALVGGCVSLGNVSGAIDLSGYDEATAEFWLTATGNLTIAPSGLIAPVTDSVVVQYLRITQDGTGSRTLTWDAAIESAYGVDVELSTTAGAVDLVGVKISNVGGSGGTTAYSHFLGEQAIA